MQAVATAVNGSMIQGFCGRKNQMAYNVEPCDRDWGQTRGATQRVLTRPKSSTGHCLSITCHLSCILLFASDAGSMQSSLTTRSSAACRAQWPVAARSGCIAAHPFRSLPSSYMHPFVPTYRASGDGCGCSSSAATSSSATNAATAHPTVGVVIVDHGSRKKASNDMLHDFGDLYQALSGREIVEVAHMEIASPTIEDAIGEATVAFTSLQWV